MTVGTYEQFLAQKVDFDSSCGIDVTPEQIHPLLKPHQRDAVSGCSSRTPSPPHSTSPTGSVSAPTPSSKRAAASAAGT